MNYKIFWVCRVIIYIYLYSVVLLFWRTILQYIRCRVQLYFVLRLTFGPVLLYAQCGH